jgi:hypothetical protein
LNGRAQSGSPDPLGRLGTSWKLRGHKRHHLFPKIICGDDPYDDETSDDPNDDDDDWDDLSGYVDSDGPIVAWLHEIVLYLSAPGAANTIRTNPPSLPPFLAFPQLRC